jgi:hypothetical protein
MILGILNKHDSVSVLTFIALPRVYRMALLAQANGYVDEITIGMIAKATAAAKESRCASGGRSRQSSLRSVCGEESKIRPPV